VARARNGAEVGRALLLPWWGIAALGVLLALVLSLVVAPAAWLDWVAMRASDGRLRLTETSGTIWHGHGRLVFADPFAEQDAKSSLRSLTSGLALPPALSWKIAPWPLFVGRLQSEIQLEGVVAPVLITGTLGSIRGSGGSLDLPTVTLDRLGSPWNTVQPRGKLSVRWEPFVVERGSFSGNAEMELASVSSALSPVKPLGHYKIRVSGQGNKATMQMSTVSGPLMLEGSGQWTGRTGLRFQATAHSAAEEQLRLQPLLGLIGRREGDRVVIKIGA
jgi:general secretion pathway protein N